jgi:hypothetical protein
MKTAGAGFPAIRQERNGLEYHTILSAFRFLNFNGYVNREKRPINITVKTDNEASMWRRSDYDFYKKSS